MNHSSQESLPTSVIAKYGEKQCMICAQKCARPNDVINIFNREHLKNNDIHKVNSVGLYCSRGLCLIARIHEKTPCHATTPSASLEEHRNALLSLTLNRKQHNLKTYVYHTDDVTYCVYCLLRVDQEGLEQCAIRHGITFSFNLKRQQT